ncbi:TatD family hydrolase [Methanococcus aeolicus]|uniref:TatD family hydrolase n=1 Tax=Methanococcus aeolicus TaxID=42879 RepID=UPI0021CA5E1A|nr:TatD family hydrolase [Methanococcus aeolicus]UXM84233.1 TatD family hydrolase [Methanococcus aeolicus]
MNNNIKNIPITDNHIHIDGVNGYGAEKVAKIFKNADGKVMIVLNKPAFNNDLKKPMDILIKDIETINKTVDGVKAYGLVGVHPAELTVMINNGIELEEAKNKMIDALDYAKKLISETDYLVGIGEVGRPHYPVNAEIWGASNEILLYAMEIANDLNCAIQIHAESTSEEQFKKLNNMAKSVNLNPNKVIKHHSDSSALNYEKYNIFPSIVATNQINEAITKSHRFVMETDYIDDLKRPGVVLGIKTVPRRTKKLIDLGLIDEEICYKIHKDNIEKLYNIEINL